MEPPPHCRQSKSTISNNGGELVPTLLVSGSEERCKQCDVTHPELSARPQLTPPNYRAWQTDRQTVHTQGLWCVAEVRDWDWDQPGWENIRALWWNSGKDFAHRVYTVRFPPRSSFYRTASDCLQWSRRFSHLQIIKIASHVNICWTICNHLFRHLSKLHTARGLTPTSMFVKSINISGLKDLHLSVIWFPLRVLCVRSGGKKILVWQAGEPTQMTTIFQAAAPHRRW